MAGCRRKQLEEWRQKNGRTPMKRFSYVMKCTPDPTRSIHTPFRETRSNIHISRTTIPALCSIKSRHAYASAKSGKFRRHGNDDENFQPRERESFRPKVVSGGVVSGGGMVCSGVATATKRMSKEELRMLRKKMLEEWQALHGRTLKRPCPLLPLQPTAREREALSQRKRRRHTMGGGESRWRRGGGGEGRRGAGGELAEEREALKRRFLREVAEEYFREEEEREDKEWEEEGDDGRKKEGDIAKELQFDTVSTTLRRKKCQHEGKSFKSTTIRFMLSEPHTRKRRHSCVSAIPTNATVYLTPVRRSTRVGRNSDTPGMRLDNDMCFDSPSDVTKQLEFEAVQLLPNSLVPLNWGD